MTPDEINRVNQKQYKSEKIYKYCPTCQQDYLVSTHISKCQVCKTFLQPSSNNPQNKPKCPLCQSTNIQKISNLKRGVHAVSFGIFSTTARSQWECKNCGNKF